jgi:hypothetical protein
MDSKSFRQLDIIEYFKPVEPASLAINVRDEDWQAKISRIEQWITKEIVIPKKVLRLRCHLNCKTRISWIQTASVWNYLLNSGKYCVVPEHKDWITCKEYVNDNGLMNEHKTLLEEKRQVYMEWAEVSLELGYHAEEVYLEAFRIAGYTANKATLPYSTADGRKEVQFDILAENDNLRLGVQVKNITSEVLTNPLGRNRTLRLYKDLTRQFEYCELKGIVPILIAPYVDKRFYNFSQRYHGLHCQTFLQLFDVEHSVLREDIKNKLNFGYTRVAEQAPMHVMKWIRRIPNCWKERYNK